MAANHVNYPDSVLCVCVFKILSFYFIFIALVRAQYYHFIYYYISFMC